MHLSFRTEIIYFHFVNEKEINTWLLLKPGRTDNIQIKDDFERGKGHNPVISNNFSILIS